MKKIRLLLLLGNGASAVAVAAWIYASDRYNGLNVGGVPGNATFWSNALALSCVLAVVLWVVTVGVAVWNASVGGTQTIVERVLWCLLSIALAPVAFFFF